MKEQRRDEVLVKLEKIEKLLDEKRGEPLNFNQAAQYLSLSHSHLYKLTSQRKIPFHKPSGKYLYFFKNELDTWIVTNEEVSRQSDMADQRKEVSMQEVGDDEEPP